MSRPRGVRRAPRAPLHPGIKQAIVEDHRTYTMHAWLCGFTHLQVYSNLLHADAVPLTYASRFQKVADLIGYTGPIFLEAANDWGAIAVTPLCVGVAEAAKMVSVGKSAIRRWIASGALPIIKFPSEKHRDESNRRVLIAVSDLEAFVEQHRIEGSIR
jgi:hypothetical protein